MKEGLGSQNAVLNSKPTRVANEGLDYRRQTKDVLKSPSKQIIKQNTNC